MDFFKTKFLRRYSSTEEEKQRMGIFHDHLKFVLESNIKKIRTFQLAMNEYSDWTAEEFDATKTGLVDSTSRRREMSDNRNNEESVRDRFSKVYQDHYHSRRLKRNLYDNNNEDEREDNDNNNNTDDQLPNAFDWRTKNVVTSVKNQGHCGCCYAFATTAVLESAYAIKTNSGNLTDFSPQQIVDCSIGMNHGCHGGSLPPTLEYLFEEGGKIATEASYPYVGIQDTCQTNSINQIDLGNIQYDRIPSGDEITMASLLINSGPIYIAINTHSDLFRFYSSGILSIENCPNGLKDLHHAVVVVGYGYDDILQKSYWIIKNSWGTEFGENGYIRIAKDEGNMCGVATKAFTATLT